jgi:DNA-binding beta-propeller fold protein YncE
MLRLTALVLTLAGALSVAGADLAAARAESAARPQHPTLLVKLAIALAAEGQDDEAVRVLERVASMGFVYSLQEPELERIRARVAGKFAANAQPIGQAQQAFTVAGRGMTPEGIAYDGSRFYVGTVKRKAIFAIDERGRSTVLTDNVPGGVYGLSFDRKRNVLWAAAESSVLRIDPKSGRILQSWKLDGDHAIGDVVAAADGEVYVSDSKGTVVYRVAGDQLVPFLTGPFRSLQGLAPWGDRLYIADYSHGLFVADRRTGDLVRLSVPANVSLLGVDGLYAADARTLFATQNGTNPNRILRVRLAAGGLAVESVETLLANDDRMTDPTLGVLARNRFYFNANGQWGEQDQEKLQDALVLSVPAR